MNLAETIRRARERQGWTQDQLAEKAGVSVMSIKNWEAGRHSPKNAIGRLEDVLGVNLREDPTDHGPSIDEASDAQLVGALLTRLADRNDTIAALRREVDDLTNGRRQPHHDDTRWAARARLRPVDDITTRPDPTPKPDDQPADGAPTPDDPS